MFSPILFQIKICIIIQQYYNDPFCVGLLLFLTLNQHITILVNSFHTFYKLFKVNEKLEI